MAVFANSTPMPAAEGPYEPWRQRLLLEHAVECAIAALDEMDGDPDLEPDDEDQEDDREPDEEGEPTLGWPNNVGKGAETLTAAWPFQLAGLDGEYEPNLAAVRGGQGA